MDVFSIQTDDINNNKKNNLNGHIIIKLFINHKDDDKQRNSKLNLVPISDYEKEINIDNTSFRMFKIGLLSVPINNQIFNKNENIHITNRNESGL